MKIGIPNETKTKENRASCTPGGARMLVQRGHEVLVQQGAGVGAGFIDEEYREAGAAAPKLIRRDMLGEMKPGAVFVDIAIDQGGCAETSCPTTHDDPIFVERDVIHYCVTNMPGAYPRTATGALVNATMPYAVKLADLGAVHAFELMPDLRHGLNTYQGMLVHPAVADALGLPGAPNPFDAAAKL